ncbi:response regulator [Nocardioides speluncae]|uniref:response regulator n=1 Tax=Nocardioides speluncae TaxID=2670337 RepID=UPI00197FF49B|nr:response regulator transcription factor [Nocardioides speluncae]
MSERPVRVVIVDDHPFYREGVKAMLTARASDITVVGEAQNGEEALEIVGSLAPDVVLMDLAMPGMGGLEATRRVVKDHAGVAVVVLTMFDDESVLSAVRAGAKGYLLKDADVDEVVRAVHAAHHGETVLGARPASTLVGYVARATAQPGPFRELTQREHEILRKIAVGADNATIARDLHLTDKTVRNYVSTILSKLHVGSRAEAVAKARDAGMGG